MPCLPLTREVSKPQVLTEGERSSEQTNCKIVGATIGRPPTLAQTKIVCVGGDAHSAPPTSAQTYCPHQASL